MLAKCWVTFSFSSNASRRHSDNKKGPKLCYLGPLHLLPVGKRVFISSLDARKESNYDPQSQNHALQQSHADASR